MKILVALTRFPWPTDKGDKLRAWRQIQSLSEQHEIHLVCQNENKPGPEEMKMVKAYCKSVEVIQLPLLLRMWNLFVALFSRIPFQVAYFRSPKTKKIIRSAIKEKKIDAVYVQLVRMNENIPADTGIPMLLDFMDAFSAGMDKRASLASGWQRIWVKKEAERLKRYEKSAPEKYSKCTIISLQDLEALSPQIQNKTIVIPNGVNELFFETGVEEKEFDILFTGNMGYHPNILAAVFLVEKIMPEVRKMGMKLKVCIAGARPSPKVKSLQNDQVSVTGPVEDLRPWFRKSRIFVAPLISGSGLQNKLLESMAMGMPTITTPISNAALGAEPGKQIWVCENEIEFAAAIVKLLTDTNLAESLGKSGQQFVKAHFDWKIANNKLEDLLVNLIHN